MKTTAPAVMAAGAVAADNPGWCRCTRGRIGVVVLASLLLALRKPWALHTPQLWAEDGTIFLTQDDQWGARALLEPYNGYLHLLPRAIAWLARNLADVAWWPAIYNGFAFAVTVGLFARLASPRVELPAKPWLILAFPLVVGSGEVLINVTNLQWVTAFFLIAHLFTRAPATMSQRITDVAILTIVGLNGPFAIAFLPLFIWHAWRTRQLDGWLSLLAVGLCAALQATLLLRTSAPLEIQGARQAFQPVGALAILGSRLVSWTYFGSGVVHPWPLRLHALLGAVLIFPVLAWSLRPGHARGLRTTLVATFLIITAACAYRLRADTWTVDFPASGDRYFYNSRVLFAWLLILACFSANRWAAWTARTLCVAAVLTHAPRFVLPAPKDYRWAEHCDPIRRGAPAKIATLPEGWWIEYPGRANP